MHLIQILLPLYDNEGAAFPREHYVDVRRHMTDRFGGVTTYSRAPAQGFWKNEGRIERDEIVVFEVMAPELDRPWWFDYRRSLERLFNQSQILLRAHEVDTL